jgi:hypothetical protein
MPAGFFGLPRELRDDIYEYVWSSMPVVLFSYAPGLIVEARYDAETDDDVAEASYLPAGLSANKLLILEALQCFHRKGDVCIDYRNKLPSNGFPDTQLTPLGFRAIELKVGTTCYDPLANLDHKSDVTEDVGSWDPESWHRRLEQADVQALQVLVNDHARIGAPTKLSIHVFLNPRWRQAPSHVNLQGLRVLGDIAGTLDTVQLDVLGRDKGVRKCFGKGLNGSLRYEAERLADKTLTDTTWTMQVLHFPEIKYVCWRFVFNTVAPDEAMIRGGRLHEIRGGRLQEIL